MIHRKSVQAKQDYQTPRWLFDYLNNKFGPFTLDAFATKENALCEKFYTEKESGLIAPWISTTFWNPPFKLIAAATHKAAGEFFKNGVMSVGIAPCNLETKWVKEALFYNAALRIIRPRVKFTGPGHAPPHATMLVIFGRLSDSPQIQIIDLRPPP